ncbi:MAG: thiolase family protein [Gammaproteobacteria bacterium]|nr:thiolase family protein [Gammaproteobacteria bacterium]
MIKKAVVSGVYNTQVGVLEGSTCMSIHAESGIGAVEDAGLKLSDIDGVLTAYATTLPHIMLGSVFCEDVGIRPAHLSSISMGGATGTMLIQEAAALVEAGYCQHVLCVTGDNRVTGHGSNVVSVISSMVGHPEFENPFGITVPASYAMVAQRYMHDYGLTNEHFAAAAVTCRKHAALHPDAHMQKPIEIDDVLNSKMIAEPLHMLDCCLISDGGGAVVVSAADTAPDLRKKPITILGSGQGHTHEHIMMAPETLDHFGCKFSAEAAFKKAGVAPQDIDVAEIYDCFTSTLLIQLESMGFYERGASGEAALTGELEIGGALPTNTHGGLLSFGSSGAAGGLWHVVEAVRQLRGEADQRQVQDAELAFAHNQGGIFSAHCSLVLGDAS